MRQGDGGGRQQGTGTTSKTGSRRGSNEKRQGMGGKHRGVKRGDSRIRQGMEGRRHFTSLLSEQTSAALMHFGALEETPTTTSKHQYTPLNTNKKKKTTITTDKHQ